MYEPKDKPIFSRRQWRLVVMAIAFAILVIYAVLTGADSVLGVLSAFLGGSGR